jgi:hypothetical protein
MMKMTMKKRYVEPLMEAMEIESEGMLCESGVNGGMSENPASTPALAPYWDEDWEEE